MLDDNLFWRPRRNQPYGIVFVHYESEVFSTNIAIS